MKMKKACLVIFGVVLSFTVFAQTTSEHLTFKNIPIDGTLNQFVANIKAAGFKSEYSQDGIVGLRGDFAGYKDCVVFVSALKNKDLVSGVVVFFPDPLSTWSSLETIYTKLKEMLTTKYGNPDEVIEEFQSRIKPEDDKSRLYELRNDRCDYHTLFCTEKGNILLQLTHLNFVFFNSVFCVTLAYRDKINSLEVEAAAMDDL